MRKLILLALLAATAAFTQQAPAAKAKVLTRVELETLLGQPDKVLLIDVRRPDEITSIGGFPVYLSIQVAELEKHLAEIPRDRVIVTVSNHAARGARAADLLAEHGFHVAGTVGAETYESEGGKLVKIAIPPPRNSEKSEKGESK
jgi:rhodanese-related sulfurtransferase